MRRGIARLDALDETAHALLEATLRTFRVRRGAVAHEVRVPPVQRRASLGGVLISSPEYAHGVPGVLKNAIDWVVSSGQIYEKPT